MSHLPRLRPLTRLLLLLRPQRPHNHHLHPLPTLTTPTINSKPQTRTLRSATATSATATTATTTAQNIPGSQPTPHPNEAYEITQAETQLTAHPLLQTLRSDKSYTETRPHLSMIPTHRASHFVAGTLSGAHKVTVPPYVFTRPKPTPKSQSPQNESTDQPAHATQPQPLAQTISLFHLGTTLNGHPGYVHGGLLSVMFDETFARCVAASFASGVGMTANLSVDFRKPARPDRVYVLRAETVRVEGRKAWVEGSLTSLPPAGSASEEEGTMVAEARALFVEPKFAESMVPLYRN